MIRARSPVIRMHVLVLSPMPQAVSCFMLLPKLPTASALLTESLWTSSATYTTV